MEELEKCVWHAFTALSDLQTGYVQKSKLKVLTNNMGNVLGFNKAEEKLDKCNSNELNFEEYLKLLKSELFTDSRLDTSPKAETIKEICWMLYKCKAWEISNQQKLHSNDAFTLWKLFNFLCEMDDSGHYSIPLVMDRDEIELLFEKFGLVTGQHADQNSMMNMLHSGKNIFSFPKILALFERQYLSRLQDDEISLGLKEIHEEIINDVIKKGFMSKKGNHVTTWKERFFVLKPKCISYYTTSDLKDQKGFIEINKHCVVVPTVDKACRFVLHTQQKNYELHVSDMKTKNEWISALQKAIDADGEDVHFHKIELCKRSKKRIILRQKEAEESLQRQKEQQIIQEKMKELEEEKQARAEAEARLQLESALREADKDHLRELEEIKLQLERLLQEERQAKRDEELVRIAQARVLEEEFEKRDELERLKVEQEKLLAEEMSKREGVEEERNKQAALLEAATLQLEKLERQHRLADQQLQNAKEKIRQVEVERSKMELRMKSNSKPIGLARPVMPQPNPIISHRGYGAFVLKEFATHQRSNQHKTYREHEREKNTEDANNNNNDDDDFILLQSPEENEESDGDRRATLNGCGDEEAEDGGSRRIEEVKRKVGEKNSLTNEKSNHKEEEDEDEDERENRDEVFKGKTKKEDIYHLGDDWLENNDGE